MSSVPSPPVSVETGGPEKRRGLAEGTWPVCGGARLLARPGFLVVSLGAEHVTKAKESSIQGFEPPFSVRLDEEPDLVVGKRWTPSQQHGGSFCLSKVSEPTEVASPAPGGGKAQHSVLLVGTSECPQVRVRCLQ